MDNGGYKIICSLGPFEIDDCGSYFSIYKNSKYIGEFKNRDNAFKYVFLEYFDEAGDYH